ncbi:MAG: thioredoxin family protein [Desulfobacterales bacterium]|nr:thioredoxin family protein [Desulfobacterales bacterium]MDX2511124.1 thioredoxin family protein [Desulfobacterales bacterium]
MINRIILTFCMTVALMIWTVAVPVSAADQIKWYSYEEGTALGMSENKKLFISFYADWCKFCKTMDQQTFQDASIISYLSSHFISVKVDVEREKSVARKYNINPLPDSWFLSEKGDIIGNRPGYLSAEDLMPILQFIKTDSFLKMSYLQFKESL